MDTLNCDAIFEFICEACVKPVYPDDYAKESSYRYAVVSFGETSTLPTSRILIASSEQNTVNVRKLVNVILYFAARFSCADESKINFLLWYAEMLCKKQHAQSITGLQYSSEHGNPEGLYWCFSPADDFRFASDPYYHTHFFTLHIQEENCFTAAQLQLLSTVGDSFITWMTDPSQPEPVRETPLRGQTVLLSR